MLTVRRADERGQSDLGWLKSHFSFSFADYFDAQHVQFSSLRVLNEDWLAPATGFPAHSHRDMEIITYMLHGTLKHRDSMGNSFVIRAGEVQRMSAGTGITHSEFNASDTEHAHFLQIWILPNQRDMEPSYQQKYFDAAQKHLRWCLIASPDGRDGSCLIQQDTFVLSSILPQGETINYSLNSRRCCYIQLARGEVRLGEQRLSVGDGLGVEDEERVSIIASQDAEILLFDLPSM